MPHPLPGGKGEWTMLNFSKSRSLRSSVLAAGLLALMGGAATAGECPADQMGVDVTKPGATEPAGVTDNVLGSIDLGQEMLKAEGRKFRLRQLVIEPGGVVPWHSHADRPAIIY